MKAWIKYFETKINYFILLSRLSLNKILRKPHFIKKKELLFIPKLQFINIVYNLIKFYYDIVCPSDANEILNLIILTNEIRFHYLKIPIFNYMMIIIIFLFFFLVFHMFYLMVIIHINQLRLSIILFLLCKFSILSYYLYLSHMLLALFDEYHMVYHFLLFSLILRQQKKKEMTNEYSRVLKDVKIRD
jgi:hypothetical protein